MAVSWVVPRCAADGAFSIAAQQFVDGGLGAGPGIHALDDHRRVQAVAAVGRGQAACDHHAAGGHATVTHRAAGAVVDARGLAEKHAHADHAATFDDHALDDFRTR